MSESSALIAAPAATPASFDLSHTSFAQAFGSLLAAATGPIGRQPPRSEGAVEDPYWLTCSKKMKVANDRVSSNESFEKMFAAYYTAHADELRKPVVGEDGRVNDAFFRSLDTETFSAPASGSAGLVGPVVYYSPTVCVPVGDIYRAALAKHRDAPATATKKKLLPTGVLLDFYAAIYHSLPDGHADLEALEANVVDLCAAAETVAPKEGPGAVAPAAPVANPMDMITSLLGAVVGAQGAEMGDALKGISGIVSHVVEQVQKTAPGEDLNDAGAVVRRLSALLASDDMQKKIAETATTASAAYNGIMARTAAPTAPTQTPPAPTQTPPE